MQILISLRNLESSNLRDFEGMKIFRTLNKYSKQNWLQCE